jgi:hypothetical protein
VLKSDFAFRNYTRACVHHSMRVSITQNSDFYTQSVMLTRMIVIMTHQNRTLRVEITLLCDFHTHTVMNTRTSVISESKV